MKKLFVEDRKTFPSPFQTLEAGIIAVGILPTVENLLEAYSFGIFPWPHDDFPLLWFCPDERGVLDFEEFHVPRSLLKEMKKHGFTYSWNRDFSGVMKGCQSAPRKGDAGTWITDELVRAYIDFHRAGYAHSVEVWQGERLVGGLYGVYVGGVFSAESMFFRVTGASKAAVVYCVDHLRKQGLDWIDVQMVSSSSRQFGGKYIPKRDFLARLEESRKKAKWLSFESHSY